MDGETVSLRVTVAETCYVNVFYVDEDKHKVWLFPNRYEPDSLVQKNVPVLIPGRPEYIIRATPSRDLEYLYVIASTQKGEGPNQLRGGTDVGENKEFKSVPQDEFEEVIGRLRGLEVVARDLRTREFIIPFRVRPKE
jgi:hypothetical protein